MRSMRLRTRAIPERLRGVITTRRYTNPSLPLPIPLLMLCTTSVLFIISAAPATVETFRHCSGHYTLCFIKKNRNQIQPIMAKTNSNCMKITQSDDVSACCEVRWNSVSK